MLISSIGVDELALRLFAAIGLAFLLGLERELRHKPMGLRTFMLVALGAATFSVVVIEMFNTIAEEDLQKAEVLGIPAALIILVVVFGALVAAGVPIVLAIVAIAVAFGLAAFIGRFVISFAG